MIYLVSTTAQLLLAFLGFSVLGYLLLRVFPRSYVSQLKVSWFHLILFGQLAAIFYVYLRSWLHALLPVVPPIQPYELGLVVMASAVALAYYQRTTLTRPVVIRWVREHAFALCAVAVCLSLVVSSELPRQSPLSTDPNIHAFYAFQLQQLGQVPIFNQGYYSDQAPTYPTFFAVLNYVWMQLTALNALNIVHIQYLIQLIIGLGVICEALLSVSTIKTVRFLYGVTIVALFLVVITILPYGYETIRWHLEGTARVAGIGLLSGLTTGILLILLRKQAQLFGSFCLVFVLAASLFLLNYIFWVLSVLAFVCLLSYGYVNFERRFWLLVLAGSVFVLILLDPVTTNILFHTAVRQMPPLAPVMTPALSWAHILLWAQTPFELNFIYQKGLLAVVTGMTVIILMFKAHHTFSKKLLISLFGLFLILPITTILVQSANQLILKNSVPIASYQLLPYTDYIFQQLLFILLMYLAGIAVMIVANSLVFQRSQITIFVLLTIGLCYLPRNQLVSPRNANHGAIGVVTASDLAVIESTEEIMAHLVQETHCLQSTCMPKIMIVPTKELMGTEKWLFPQNAGAVLPLHRVFPVAFFYGMFSDEFTFDSYDQTVTDNFPADFIQRHNIQYLFISNLDDQSSPEIQELLKITQPIVTQENAGLYAFQ